jgi:REP element-mobilizing transposase RayT
MNYAYQSLSHSKWDCKYHVVFVSKYRRKALFGEIRKNLGPIFHELTRQKVCQVVEGHSMVDHVHVCIAIPPKRSVASVIGFLKAKAPLPSYGCGAESGTLPESISGRAVMRFQPSGSTKKRFVATFATRKAPMGAVVSEVALGIMSH